MSTFRFPGVVKPAPMVIADAVRDADEHRLTVLREALEKAGIGTMKVRDRIRLAVRTRIEQHAGSKETARRALALLALPLNARLGLKLLYRTVDAMWYAAGDTSADFNFYTKRATLAGVYSSTLLFWLNDRSPGDEATWAFLGRRIDNVMSFEKLKGQFTSRARAASSRR